MNMGFVLSPCGRTVRSHAGRLLLWLAVCCAAALLPRWAAAAVPNPVVIGPVAANVAPGHPTHDYPWMSTMLNLAAAGYVEEEYFYEGTARRFNTPSGADGSVISSGHPYRTRLLVRRPVSPKHFNGTVLAEWQNVTAGYDLDAMWGANFEHIMRSGYVWVGISAQRVGVQGDPNGLRNWSPLRYGTLDVTAGGTITDDALSYDIFAQGLQALRHPQGVNALGRMVPQRVIAMGASQSASRLGTYINSLHGLLGDPVDAYFVYIGGARIRDTVPVPVFKVLSETDVPGQVLSRQPDTALFRGWEVAGASHSGRRTALNSRPLLLRDHVAPAIGTCTNPPYARVPVQHVTNAVYDHIVRWVRDGIAPPTAPRITTSGLTIVRDARGNALGGLRLPEFAVPTALNSGANSGSSFCSLYGSHVPFSDATIAQLYPTPSTYTTQIDAQLAASLEAGYIVAADGARTQYLARQSTVGTGWPCGSTCRAALDLLEATHFYLAPMPQANDAADKVLGFIRLIGQAEAAGGTTQAAATAAARRNLQRYVDGLNAMRGQLPSSTGIDELVNGAGAILATLP